MRVGMGYDVHKLVENRKLILGGVEIPYEYGLLGHSDADVLVHAIMDALLGAAALRDIGRHFPDNDPAYEGADSIELLKKVGLADKAKAYPCELSGGQQQRVAIVRALAMSPSILFFDEPTSALDPELTGEILEVIRLLAEDHMTMVIVTHEMSFARAISNRIIFMADGYIVEEGTPEQIFERPAQERTRQFLAHYQ